MRPQRFPWCRPSWAAALVGATLLLAHVAGALAGAFNQPAGQGQVILQGTFDQGQKAYSADGRHLVAVSSYHKLEGSAYVEYGLTDWLEIIFKPDLVSTRIAGAPGGRYTGLGTSELGAQAQLLMFGPAVLAVQGTFQLPSTTSQANLALIGNTSRNTDGRLLFGYNFPLGSWPSFIDAEAGYRLRMGGAPDEVHVDLTAGTRPWANVMLLLQDFTTIPVGAGTPWFPRSQYSNLEASVVYEFTQRWAIQVGLFTTVEGHNALHEQGIDLALWHHF